MQQQPPFALRPHLHRQRPLVRALRGACAAAALMLATGAACAQPASVVRALLDDAAVRFDIPRPILYGIAYTESRWRHMPADSVAPAGAPNGTPACSGMPPGIGVMGLHDDAYFGHSLAAAEAIGITPEDARAGVAKNILAGAYHLSTLFTGGDRRDMRSWIDAIGAYPGIPAEQPELRLLYIDGVFEAMRRGWYAGDQYVAPCEPPAIDRAKLKRDLERIGLRAVDYTGAEWHASPNFSSREGTAITAITIHDTEGSFAGSLSWLINPDAQASAHYMIRSVDGFIVQMVEEKEKAWHVRTENPYTIGIEHEGYVAQPEYFTPQLYAASSDLVRYLIGKYHIPLDRTHVKGHIDYPNNTHTDPGGWWDWPAYFRMIDRNPNETVVLDPFEDNVIGWWQPAMSGSTTRVDTAATTFSISGDAALHGSAGGRLAYAFTEASGGVARAFRSGHGNVTDGLLNVGTSGIVTLAVRGDASGNRLELWFYDPAKGNLPVVAGDITWTGWRTVSVPVSVLGTNGPYRFHSIVVRQMPGGARAGSITVDDLAHATAPAGVEQQAAPAASEAIRIAVASDQPIPPTLLPAGPIRIYSLDGIELARVAGLPSAPVGSYLQPGVYVLAGERAHALLLVTR